MLRLIYDQLYSRFVPSSTDLKPTQISQVLLLSLPATTIRAEDFDLAAWKAQGFVGPDPSRLLFELTDDVPTYSSVVWAPSGRKISQMYRTALTLAVVANSSAAELLADQALDVPEPAVRALSSLQADMEASLSAAYDAVFSCLREGSPLEGAAVASLCAQKAVFQKRRQASQLLDLLSLDSSVAGRQGALIRRAQSLPLRLASALEALDAHRRADAGASSSGAEYYAVNFQPANWLDWWLPNPASYDAVADPSGRAVITDLVLPAPATVIAVAPTRGTAALVGAAIVYQANPGYVGADYFSYETDMAPLFGCVAGSPPCACLPGWSGAGCSLRRVTKTLATSAFDPASDAAFVKFSASAGAAYPAASSPFASFHVQNGIADGAPLGTVSGTNLSSFSFYDPAMRVSFEAALVRVDRPWLDLSVLRTPFAVEGYQKHAWSDGTPWFPQRSRPREFALLPTAFVVARNIRINTAQLGQVASVLASTASPSSSIPSVTVGPFVAGTAYSPTSQSTQHTFNAATYTPPDYLEIPGPQIIGWFCTPMPAFPLLNPSD